MFIAVQKDNAYAPVSIYDVTVSDGVNLADPPPSHPHASATKIETEPRIEAV